MKGGDSSFRTPFDLIHCSRCKYFLLFVPVLSFFLLVYSSFSSFSHGQFLVYAEVLRNNYPNVTRILETLQTYENAHLFCS